jgi:hypothetical protein
MIQRVSFSSTEGFLPVGVAHLEQENGGLDGSPNRALAYNIGIIDLIKKGCESSPSRDRQAISGEKHERLCSSS